MMHETDQGVVIEIADTVDIGARPVPIGALPAGFRLDREIGIVAHEGMTVQRIHAQPPPEDWVGEVRAAQTPRSGDYLCMFTAGRGHYGGRFGDRFEKANDMVAYRSADRGRTWTGPTVAWELAYNQHGFIPFVPRGSHILYAFGTEPRPEEHEDRENAPIAFRASEDDGRTWSEPTFIRPTNAPGFRGMSVMRMTETDAGAWLLGSHTAVGKRAAARWTHGDLATRQYLLRSADGGRTWAALPGPRPDGWFAPGYDRMDEGRPLALPGGGAIVMIRTPQGRLWLSRSSDDGQTWTPPTPTPLVHPDAPPMLFALADGQTLVAFHHNRHTGGDFNHADRAELWVSRSTDGGARWDAPRFVLANAAKPPAGKGPLHAASVSYADMLTDGNDLHLFICHQFRQAVHVRFAVDLLDHLPTHADLGVGCA